jgi:5'-deoxynucleotidase YfbR-like HD superfamily hydrolase
MTETVLDHGEIERLMAELILPFHQIKRDIKLPHGERRHENDAEHSWSLTFLAACLSPLVDPALDVGRVCQLATAHDVVEVFAGDTSVFAEQAHLATKDQREKAALAKLRRDFPHFPWIADMVKDYKTLASNEARFVYALDKYVTVLFDFMDKGRYLQEIKMTQKQYHQDLAAHQRKAHMHPGVGEYYDRVRELLDEHPEFFYPAKLPAKENL